ncbi:MAG: hypothetical protein HY391_04880, partial [Deltaproteobacteria bacterium]|nr:hypothetical protein [Deltaproteobacteria bacterium]
MFKGLKVMLGLSFLLVMGAEANLHADEGAVGNGGGAWVCRDWIGGKEVIRWSVLVDLYEGREEFDLSIPEVSGEWR